MGLWNRITGVGILVTEEKIPVHQFQGAMTEWTYTEQEPAWSFVTRADVIASFSIQPAEEAYLDALFAKFDNASSLLDMSKVFDNVCLLAEQERLGYEVQAKFDQRLTDQSNQ